jgi:hypothetical protein
MRASQRKAPKAQGRGTKGEKKMSKYKTLKELPKSVQEGAAVGAFFGKTKKAKKRKAGPIVKTYTT